MTKKKSGWTGLSPSQQASWKAENFSKSIKVSESTIQGLRAGKTFEGNVAKFKTGATAEQREAMNRFYGKSRVDSALGGTVSGVNKTYGSSAGPGFKGVGQNNYTPPKTAPAPKPANLGSGRYAFGTQKPYTPKKSSGNAITNSEEFKNWSKGAATATGVIATIYGPGKILKAPKFIAGLFKGSKAAPKVTPKQPIALPGRPTPKAIGPGPLGPKAPIALGSGPIGRAAAKTGALDAKYVAASARARSASAALKKAQKKQRQGLLSSGEVKAVAKTAELERINVGIIANKARASRGLKPNPVKVGPIFQKPTTARNVAIPANSGKTKASASPPKTAPAPKAPKTAKKVATPKQRMKANTTGAKEMRKAIAPGSSRVTPMGSTSRVASDIKTEATRARLTRQLENKGDAYRQELRSKYAGGRNTEPRAWEKRVTKQGGGPKSGASVTAASKAAKKSGVEVTVGKSKEAIKAARPKKVAKKTTKKTTTKGKK